MQYGQFQPINKQETEQEKRKRRNNTFGMELPKDFIREHGGKRKLIQIILVRVRRDHTHIKTRERERETKDKKT